MTDQDDCDNYVDYVNELPDQSNEYVAKEMKLWLLDVHQHLEEDHEQEILKSHWDKFTYKERYTRFADGKQVFAKTWEKRAHDVFVKFDRPCQTLEEAFFNYGERENDIADPDGKNLSVLYKFEELPHSLYVALHRRSISEEKGPDGYRIVRDVHDPIGCPLEIDFAAGGFSNAISDTCTPKKYALVGVQVVTPGSEPGMHSWWGYIRQMVTDSEWLALDSKGKFRRDKTIGRDQLLAYLSCKGNDDAVFPYRLWYREKLDLKAALMRCPVPMRVPVFNHANELVGYSPTTDLPPNVDNKMRKIQVGRTAWEIYFARVLTVFVGREGVSVSTDEEIDAVKEVVGRVWHAMTPQHQDLWRQNASRCNLSLCNKLAPFHKCSTHELFREQWCCAIVDADFSKIPDECVALSAHLQFMSKGGFFETMWQKMSDENCQWFVSVTAWRNSLVGVCEEQCMLEVNEKIHDDLSEKLDLPSGEWKERAMDLLRDEKTTPHQLLQHFRTPHWPGPDLWTKVHKGRKQQVAETAQPSGKSQPWWQRAAEKSSQGRASGPKAEVAQMTGVVTQASAEPSESHERRSGVMTTVHADGSKTRQRVTLQLPKTLRSVDAELVLGDGNVVLDNEFVDPKTPVDGALAPPAPPADLVKEKTAVASIESQWVFGKKPYFPDTDCWYKSTGGASRGDTRNANVYAVSCSDGKKYEMWVPKSMDPKGDAVVREVTDDADHVPEYKPKPKHKHKPTPPPPVEEKHARTVLPFRDRVEKMRNRVAAEVDRSSNPESFGDDARHLAQEARAAAYRAEVKAEKERDRKEAEAREKWRKENPEEVARLEAKWAAEAEANRAKQVAARKARLAREAEEAEREADEKRRAKWAADDAEFKYREETRASRVAQEEREREAKKEAARLADEAADAKRAADKEARAAARAEKKDKKKAGKGKNWVNPIKEHEEAQKRYSKQVEDEKAAAKDAAAAKEAADKQAAAEERERKMAIQAEEAARIAAAEAQAHVNRESKKATKLAKKHAPAPAPEPHEPEGLLSDALEPAAAAAAPPLSPELNDSSCVVCMEGPKDHVCLPCAHACLCATCAGNPRLGECPICRASIAQIIRIFL